MQPSLPVTTERLHPCPARYRLGRCRRREGEGREGRQWQPRYSIAPRLHCIASHRIGPSEGISASALLEAGLPLLDREKAAYCSTSSIDRVQISGLPFFIFPPSKRRREVEERALFAKAKQSRRRRRRRRCPGFGMR